MMTTSSIPIATSQKCIVSCIEKHGNGSLVKNEKNTLDMWASNPRFRFKILFFVAFFFSSLFVKAQDTNVKLEKIFFRSLRLG